MPFKKRKNELKERENGPVANLIFIHIVDAQRSLRKAVSKRKSKSIAIPPLAEMACVVLAHELSFRCNFHSLPHCGNNSRFLVSSFAFLFPYLHFSCVVGYLLMAALATRL